MPNKSPSQEYHILPLTEREKELKQDNFNVTIDNHRELGEIIAEYDRKKTWDIPFVGVAECSTVDGMLVLKIELVADMTEMYRCSHCGLVPERPTTDNPGWCITCMKKVCSSCVHVHRQKCKLPPIKTIGGDEIPF